MSTLKTFYEAFISSLVSQEDSFISGTDNWDLSYLESIEVFLALGKRKSLL